MLGEHKHDGVAQQDHSRLARSGGGSDSVEGKRIVLILARWHQLYRHHDLI
jgi:hypothetical protein